MNEIMINRLKTYLSQQPEIIVDDLAVFGFWCIKKTDG
jgi:hypothetical protein